ncbi:MAG: isopeptide-forming domain-containing fimbrial protein, partial [Coriobacteriia bacterium]|nr:isopeptide-forming domain-containing fimbrial protein [Coriobacteriia bacterium]
AQVYTGTQTGTTASYIFDSKDIDLTTLAGKTVDMYVTASLIQVSGLYPTDVVNKGQLIVNANEDDNNKPKPKDIDGPPITNTGRIYGFLYNDVDRDGVYTPGVDTPITTPQTITATDVNDPSKIYTIQSNPDGSYALDIPAGTYLVTFPALIDNMGRTTAPSSGKVDGVIITLGDSAAQTKRLDSGYATPSDDAIKELKDSFTKTVDDGNGNYMTAATITDARAPLNYKLSFTFPTNMAGFASIEVKDVMPAGLELDPSVDPNVVVKLGGSTISSDQQSGTTASYLFDGSTTDLFALAGKTVDMYVSARLVKVNGDYLTDITNTGQIIINAVLSPAGPGPIEVPGPSVTNTCVIKGVLFDDANGNGIMDATETGRYPDKTVKLYAATSSSAALSVAPLAATGLQIAAVAASSVPVATTQTDANGNYSFEVVPGTYYVVFPNLKPLVFTGNTNGQSANVTVSYASAQDQVQVANQGYKMPAPPAALPKTGDIVSIVTPLIGLAAALLFFFILLAWKRRREDEDEGTRVNLA